jgi:hypothetical protein
MAKSTQASRIFARFAWQLRLLVASTKNRMVGLKKLNNDWEVELDVHDDRKGHVDPESTDLAPEKNCET